MTDLRHALGEDLYRHICEAVADRPVGPVHWVMNIEWLMECRRVDVGGTPFWLPSLTGADHLLGLPVEVREDGGIPHLVAD